MQSRARRRVALSEGHDLLSGVKNEEISDNTYIVEPEEEFKEKSKYPVSFGTSWLPSIPHKFLSNIINPISISNTNQQSTIPFDLKDNSDHYLSEDNEPEFMMTARDRSTEFSNAIRSLQGRNIQRAANVRDPRKAKQLQSYSEFMMIAKHIGKNIASTYTKLEKLTLLAKRKTLFDDRPAEVQELTYIIKGDLHSLNQQIARLQEVSKCQRKSTTGKHLLSHSSNMVVALQAKLANMSSDFKQVLEVRTENLKQQKSRRDQFSQGPISSSLPPSTMRGSTQSSLLLQEQQEQTTIDMNSSGAAERVPLLQQQHQLVLYDESDSYVQERAETMQNIESTIVELGGIFQQLAHMVKEQEEMVERIDTNLQDVELNVEAAHGEILKYFQSVTKNRWLMIKIFGILILFFIFFVIFLA
ncbi:syntaxin-5 [Wyeomyia smithii]|uniref:syntaxin-5 n=1 Tax=Wyeomyia smithii TaxID=174621 RepID=UPI0024681C5B|nr:syntaxin-5 [Wyeomyia smithii]XP_055547633.1 syntaxin-5 [Wyeomyia smithii]XP_055547634.1 syntaxin-5 [Wyeomyia smithii]